MEEASSDYTCKEQDIVWLFFRCMGFVETVKSSAFVICSVYVWEDSPLPAGSKEVVLLPILLLPLFLKEMVSCYLTSARS